MEVRNENERNVSNTKNYYPPLARCELWIYAVLWISGHIWSISRTFYVSRENRSYYHQRGYLEQGWWDNYLTDTTDFEWFFWNKFLYKVIIIGFSGHFLLARVADIFFPKYRFKIFMIYSVIATIQFLGLHGLAYLLMHFAVQYVAAVVSKNAIVCWISGIGLVYTLANRTCVSYVKSYYEDEDEAYFLMFTTAMCNLRYISFSLEYVWALENSPAVPDNDTPNPILHGKESGTDLLRENLRQRKPDKTKKTSNLSEREEDEKEKLTFTFLDLLVYQMYYPLFYGGPILTYNDFAAQIRRPPVNWTRKQIAWFLLGMLRFIFWQFSMDFMLQFMYFSAIHHDYYLLTKLPLVTMCGLSLCHVYFFYMKYLMMYGMPAHFSSSDNLNVPGKPHCVGSRHRITDMWRYFDKGLHKWLVRYIYIPCKGSSTSIFRTTISSVLTFVFVCYWHGASKAQIYWASLSWVGVFVEMIASKVYKMQSVKEFEAKCLSPEWSRRVRAMLSSITFGFLILTNIYFLSGTFVANLYMKRLYTEDIGITLMVHSVLYTGVHISMEIMRMGF